MQDQATQNEQLTQALLQSLRDIHLPDAVSWWPLAVGWWILGAVIIALVSGAIYTFWQRQQRNRYRQQALKELEAHFRDWQSTNNTSVYLHFANALLKRIVQHIEPSTAHKHKTGQDWINALNHYLDVPLAPTVTQALTIAQYQPNPSVDVNNLQASLCRWIEVHQCPKQEKLNTSTGNNHAEC